VRVSPAGPPLAQLPPDPRERALAEAAAELFGREHLRRRPVDDALSREAFDVFLERLDGAKLFLLADHIAALTRYATLMDDELRAGDLELARVGAKLLADRQVAVAAIIAAHLAQPFDFSVNETIETDPDKLAFAATDEELAERWRRVLKLQALERIAQLEETAQGLAKAKAKPDAKQAVAAQLADIPTTFEGREAKVREDMAKSYEGRFSRLAKTEPLEAAERFINAVASIYDPHTLYLPPADKENFDIAMSGSLEGIGAVLSEDDHFIRVREIVPGGASWRQGELEANDLILAVAQNGEQPVDVADMRINQVVQMIRGPKGSRVTLTVRKPDGRVLGIAITRDVVEIEASYARGAILDLGPAHAPVGYIFLPSFYGNTRARPGQTPERNSSDDVRALLDTFRARELSGVVLDLRGNGGGLLDHARDITGHLIETGPVVQTRYSNGESQVLADTDPSIAFRGDVVVLVDHFSASASEIVASALQDYRRAVVVGASATHGKGTVQVLLDLDRMRKQPGKPLGVFKVTIQQFFGIDGDSTQERGVISDIVLPDTMDFAETAERYLEHPIPWSKIAGLEFVPWPAAPDLAKLVEHSLARRAKRPIFATIAARSELLKARRDDTLLPLERGAWQAKRDQDRRALEQLDPETGDQPALFQVTALELEGDPKDQADERERAIAEQLARWRDGLARDPWLEESLFVLADLAAR
jgi:carboxyl-terminal processing protease